MSEFITLKELPTVLFAHNYSGETYDNRFDETEDFLEIGYIVYGDIYCRCGSDEGTAREGDVYILTKRGKTVCKSTAPSEHRCVGMKVKYGEQLPGDFLIIGHSDSTLQAKRLIDRLILLSNVEPELTQRVYSLCFALIDEVNTIRRSNLTPPEISGEITYVNKLKRYIGEDLSRRITLKDLSAHVGLSEGYLCVIFKKITGMTVIEYVNSRRLNLMKSLITEKNLPIKEACRLSGIADPAYASRLFKKTERQTIKDYRMSHKK